MCFDTGHEKTDYVFIVYLAKVIKLCLLILHIKQAKQTNMQTNSSI